MAGADMEGLTRPAPARARRPDWPERLVELVEARRETAFAWGPHDCCSFAADAVLAICGADPMAPHRGAYASEAEAQAIIGDRGLEVAVADLLAAFGAPECPPALAQRGDWALVSVGNDLVCGVVLVGVVAVPGLEHLAFVPVRRILRAWVI